MSGPARPPSARSLTWKRLAIAAIPVIVLVTVNAAYVVSAVRLRGAEADIRRAYAAKAELQGILSDLSQAEGGVGAFSLTRDVQFLEPLDRARQLLSVRENRLHDMLSDSRQVEDLRNNLVKVSRARLAALDRIRDDVTGHSENASASLTASRNEMQALQTIVSRMIGRQDELLSEQRVAVRNLEIVGTAMAIAGALAGVLSGVIAGIFLSSRDGSRARRAPDTTRRASAHPPSSPAVIKKLVGSVLIVDDDARIRELLHRWLAPHGLELREAADAPSAVSALTEWTPSVILCDVHMPGKDGLWLAERVREQAPDTAIVLATGDSNISPFETLRKGVVSYVLKPFRRDQVLAAVEKGLSWSSVDRRTGVSVPRSE